MTRLPAVRPARVVRALERAGFVMRRITGSHYQMTPVTDAGTWIAESIGRHKAMGHG